MTEPLKKDLREIKFPNPFSVMFTGDRPRYRPGSTFASIPVGPDCLTIRYLPRDSLESPAHCQEYARNVLVQIIRDWMQPRLNYWARQMADLDAKLCIVEYTEIAMATLWNLHLVLDELLCLFLTREEQESTGGGALRMELRERLLPQVTIKPLYQIITTTLEVADAIVNELIDENEGGRYPSFSSYADVDDAIYSTTKEEPSLTVVVSEEDQRVSEEEKRVSEEDQRVSEEEELVIRRIAEEKVLLKRIRKLYEDLNLRSSLLWGLSHVPALAVCKKRAHKMVGQTTRDVTDTKMFNDMKVSLDELKLFLRWFAYPIGKEPRSVDDEWEDLFIDMKGMIEKMTIDRLVGKIYRITIDDFPKTRGTVGLLGSFLNRHILYGRDRVVSALIAEVSSKLLRVGTPTFAILQAYTSAVESLRLLDSSCVIMHRVCNVIKDYIKKRPDTVRQIITYLTTEKRDDIDFSKQKSSTIVVDDDDVLDFNDEFLDEPHPKWEGWSPDPPDAQPGQSSRHRKSADVFNMLVSVYGSKEMFVKEYRQLLAERLNNHLTRDHDWERKYLDLLHFRFSYGELQQCEVMLRDVKQSEGINSKTRQCAPLIRGHVISSHFWPNIEKEKGVEKLPTGIEEELEEYNKEYGKTHRNRHLNWMRASGVTELSLTIDDVKIEKTVPNVMATVLYAYLEKEEWDVNEMAEHLKLTKKVAKRRMEWWEAQGVLTQFVPTGATTEVFRLTKNPANMHRFKSNMDCVDDDSEEEEAEDSVEAVEALEQFWKYTQSFITNQENGEVKAERMHNIYRLFQSPSSQPISLDTVVAFLMRKVKLGLLTTNNGLYKVVKEAEGKIKA